MCSDHCGFSDCLQNTAGSPQKRAKTLKVFKTTLPRCLFTGCSSASFQKLVTQDGSDPGPAMLPSDLTPLTTTQICLSLSKKLTLKPKAQNPTAELLHTGKEGENLDPQQQEKTFTSSRANHRQGQWKSGLIIYRLSLFLKPNTKEPPSLRLQVKGYLLAPALGTRVAFGIPQVPPPPLLAGVPNIICKTKGKGPFSGTTLA